jgi:iron complex outermembrane receptor protein
MYVEVTLYDLEGRNEIINQLLPDNTTQNQNAGATRHRGIEYSVAYAPVSELSFRFSGTNAKHTYVDYSEVATNFSTGRKHRYRLQWQPHEQRAKLDSQLRAYLQTGIH